MSNRPRGKAIFSVENPPPAGGICLSSFVVVSNGPGILLGKMKKPEIWVERFFVSPQFVPRYLLEEKYLMPASHLAWYESPLDAADRILKEQALVNFPKEKIKLIGVQSHLRGDLNDEENPPHWDICFVYEARLPAKAAKKIKSPEWFEDFGFKPMSKLTAESFARGHGDVLEEAHLIGKKNRMK
jgi:ADP-ribose pyrophosphatase YjhB (NUDIX family)